MSERPTILPYKPSGIAIFRLVETNSLDQSLKINFSADQTSYPAEPTWAFLGSFAAAEHLLYSFNRHF